MSVKEPTTQFLSMTLPRMQIFHKVV